MNTIKSNSSNPLGLTGIEFVEFTGPNTTAIENIFYSFGFSKLKTHLKRPIDYFKQNQIHFLINSEKNSNAELFSASHGPSISSMGWKFKNPEEAYHTALLRGAVKANTSDYYIDQKPVPAIIGIGGSLIYFIQEKNNDSESDRLYSALGFQDLLEPVIKKEKGFTRIDHLTNNVEFGTMQKWAEFYKTIFGFTEVRYFDIRGAKTGLTSYALQSPCKNFCIPINEAGEEKSQINEYLREYRGPGIQHLAFLTNDIIQSVKALQSSSIQTLDIDPEYYTDVFQRVKNVKEDQRVLRRLKNFSRW